jgi:thiamine-monophosphate kinase
MAKEIVHNLNPEAMPAWLGVFCNDMNRKRVVAGIDEDDCAVIQLGNEQLVITSDFLNANPIVMEFGLGSYSILGELLVASNLSDLLGSGALPIAFMTSLTFRKQDATSSDFENFMNGVKKQLSKYDIPLVGGDTKLGNDNAFCGIAIGMRRKGTRLFLKNGAKPGDNIWVSGKIGSVGAAIDGLGKADMSEDWNKWAERKIVVPRLPYKKSRRLAKLGLINSGTDLSDGLGADLYSLCRSSAVGAVIESDRIPLSSKVKTLSLKRGVEPWKYAFTVGGDFQFLVTSEVNVNLREYGFTKIGEIIKETSFSLAVNGQSYELPTIGHSDFRVESFKSEVSILINNIKAGQ